MGSISPGKDADLALYDGDPPLEAYPTADRGRIEELQKELRERRDAPAAGGTSRA